MKSTQMLRDSWAFYKSHWKILTSIVMLPTFFVYVGKAFLVVKTIPFQIIGAFLSIVGILLFVVMQVAIIDSIRKLESGDSTPQTLGDQYKFGFGLFWSIIFLIIINLLIMIGSSVLFIIPGIIACVFTSLYVYPLVLEGKRGFSALLESYSVVKGRFWETLWKLAFIVIVYIVATLIFAGVHAIINAVFGFAHNSAGDLSTRDIISFALSTFLGPVMVIYTYKLYNYLKSARLPDVSTLVFKRWLVTFIVIGVFLVMLIPIAVINIMSLVKNVNVDVKVNDNSVNIQVNK